MKTFVHESQIADLIDYVSLNGGYISSPSIKFQNYYGGSIDSHWIDISNDETENWIPVEVFDVQINMAEFKSLDIESYCPSELGLAICYAIISEHGYVPIRKSVENLSATTVSISNEIYISLYDGTKGHYSEIQTKIESLKAKKQILKNKAKWILDVLERHDGASNFTSNARNVLANGIPDFKVFAWLANEVYKSNQQQRQFSMPDRPLDLERSKIMDIPGVWQIRRIKEFNSFYGPKVFYVCADAQNCGVCFSLSPEASIDAGVSVGDFVTIRAGVAGKHESGKMTKIERVKLCLSSM